MKKITIIMISLFLLSGCFSSSEPQKFTETTTQAGFDTSIVLLAYTEDEKQFQQFFKQMKESFYHYHQLFDKYHDYEGVTNIKTINDQAGIASLKVDGDILEMLKLAKQFYEVSDHHFDVTMGSVLNIWHDVREAGTKLNEKGESGALPDMQKLQEAKANIGFQYLEINEKDSTVYLTNPKVSLDVGAIAKGYATEKVAKKLEKAGLKHAIINAGGNVRIIGSKPGNEDWSVGIQSPDVTQSSSLASVAVKKNYSFVTSGDYQRYYLIDDKMIHHIIDPDTLMPADHQRAVTVIAKDSGMADALSTTLFTLPYKEGIKLIETLQKQDIDVEAIWVFDQNEKAPDQVKQYSSSSYQLVITPNLTDKITVH